MNNIFEFFVENIYILKFLLFLLFIMLIVLIFWELGFLGGPVKAKKIKREQESVTAQMQAGSPISEKPAEEYDPFKALLKQQEETSSNVEVVESSVLDAIMQPHEHESAQKEEEKTSEVIDINDYLSREPGASLKKTEPPAQKMEEASFISIDAVKDKPVEDGVSSAGAQGAPDDPWRAMLEKSIEESNKEKKKSIKIDLDEPAQGAGDENAGKQ